MLFLWFCVFVVATHVYENHSIGHLQRPSRLRRSLTVFIYVEKHQEPR